MQGGENHIIYLEACGNVWGNGEGKRGQLGSLSNQSDKVERISELTNIIQLSTGPQHSIFLHENGYVLGCGSNQAGQLSGGDVSTCFTIRRIFNLVNIVEISAKYHHLLAIDGNGIVWGCGNNNYKQLGEGLARILTPRQVPGLPPCKSIFTGYECSYAIDYEDNLWGLGNNCDGQIAETGKRESLSAIKLEDLPFSGNVNFIDLGENQTAVLDKEKQLWIKKYRVNRLAKEKKLQKIDSEPVVQIFVTYRGVLFLDENQNVWLFHKEMRKIEFEEAIVNIFGSHRFFMAKSETGNFYLIDIPRVDQVIPPPVLLNFPFKLHEGSNEATKSARAV